MIRDRIVVGKGDEALPEKLQLESDLTLERAISQARQKEPVYNQQGLLRPETQHAIGCVDGVKLHNAPDKFKFTPST